MSTSEVDSRTCSNDLYSYLLTLKAHVIDRLYEYPETCLAILRGLPAVVKHVVIRSAFLDGAVELQDVRLWLNDGKTLDSTVEQLKKLRIWMEHRFNGTIAYDVHPSFRHSIKIVLCGKDGVTEDPENETTLQHRRDVDFLDQYCKERWDSVLYLMTGCVPPEGSSAVSQDVVKVLISAGLIRMSGSDSSTTITSDGFQFLLMDTPSQVWHFLLRYLESAESRSLDTADCLALLFQLSFSSLGKDYPVKRLTTSQVTFIQHLREIGLVYQRKRSWPRFYPTRLAISFGSAIIGASPAADDIPQESYILVETNHRVYAYTNSPLQIALLSLFAEVKVRFPNMVVGLLSRESVHQALASGITAEQIIHFMQSRAHPVMQARPSVLPPTISDQIRLWELERDRLRSNEGVLYNQFLSQADFDALCEYSMKEGILVWSNSGKRAMVVTTEGHNLVKAYWKSRKNN